MSKIINETNIITFAVSIGKFQSCRSLSDKYLSILLKKEKDFWILPGKELEDNETLYKAADNILVKETGLENVYKEQLYTFSDLNRVPNKHIITTSYLALIDKEKTKKDLEKNTSWFNISGGEYNGHIRLVMSNEDDIIEIEYERKIFDKTTGKCEYNIIKSEGIGYDHAKILICGLEVMHSNVVNTDIIFNLMPEYFTLGELQQVYEMFLGKKLLDPAFRRIIQNKVIKTDEIIKTGGHRPSILYKYNRD